MLNSAALIVTLISFSSLLSFIVPSPTWASEYVGWVFSVQQVFSAWIFMLFPLAWMWSLFFKAAHEGIAFRLLCNVHNKYMNTCMLEVNIKSYVTQLLAKYEILDLCTINSFCYPKETIMVVFVIFHQNITSYSAFEMCTVRYIISSWIQICFAVMVHAVSGIDMYSACHSLSIQPDFTRLIKYNYFTFVSLVAKFRHMKMYNF